MSEFDIDSTKKENSKLIDFHNQINFKADDNTSIGITNYSNNFESFLKSNEYSAIMEQCNDVIPSKLCTFSDNAP
ncbi:hypothetical protein NL478_27815, partial [Klebsiella pneumoniae]|nr:hypothetical protein [Klebsiella pneumoniae]